MNTKKNSSFSTDELYELSHILCDKINNFTKIFQGFRNDMLLPSKQEIIKLADRIRSVLFPGFYSEKGLNPQSLTFNVAEMIDVIFHSLKEQIKCGFCFVAGEHEQHCEQCEKRAEKIARQFISELPKIQECLLADAQAAFDGDPSATSVDECIYSYPGILALTNYRTAHLLYKLKVPIIPRIITEYAHSITGIDIHPGAEIGRSFFIDHGTGVVIGETTIIGNNVRLYQGVTLGAKSFPLDENGNPIKGIQRHPVLEDDVIVYAGATVLGRITIGKGNVIGGNSWVTKDIPAKEK